MSRKVEKSPYIVFKKSLEDLEGSSVIIISEHNSSLEQKLEKIGRNGEFESRFLVLAICGKYNSSELASRILRRYHASGVMWYPHAIHLKAVDLMVHEIISIVEEHPGMMIDDVVAEAIRKVTNSKSNSEVQEKFMYLECLKTYFVQIS